MASGQTQYYGLSQWEAADKVERVDFNSDNAKIDGALHTLAEGAVWEKLGRQGQVSHKCPSLSTSPASAATDRCS